MSKYIQLTGVSQYSNCTVPVYYAITAQDTCQQSTCVVTGGGGNGSGTSGYTQDQCYNSPETVDSIIEKLPNLDFFIVYASKNADCSNPYYANAHQVNNGCAFNGNWTAYMLPNGNFSFTQGGCSGTKYTSEFSTACVKGTRYAFRQKTVSTGTPGSTPLPSHAKSLTSSWTALALTFCLALFL